MPADAVTPGQRMLLDRHLDELDRWTRRLNLTTVPRDRAWDRHVGESATLLAAASPAHGSRCADLGSGGGVPGIPVAVLRPDLRVSLVESDLRKAGFLVHVCGLLGLANVAVVDRRAEEMARDDAHAAAYDTVLSRACAPPQRLWELSRPLLRNGGALWALVSPAAAAVALEDLAGDPRARAESPVPGVLGIHRIDGG